MPMPLKNRRLFVLAIIIANVLLSAFSVTLDSVVNNDGITYLAMAELILNGEWKAASEFYSWPFYPMLIAATAKLLFMDVTFAAHLLNTLLATSMTLAFISVVGELSNNHFRTILIAALVIVFFPSISKYRAYIIRDFGYLSFYMWSLYFIVRFTTSLDRKHLIGWLSTGLLSCLFRFEGIIFMLVAPYFLFMFSNKHIPHKKKVLALLSCLMLISSALVLYLYLQEKYNASVQMAQLAGHDVNNFFELFLNNFKTQLEDNNAGLLAYITPLFFTILHIADDLARRMAGIFLIICIIAYYKGFTPFKVFTKRIWIAYLCTNLILLLGFSLVNNMSVSRYALAACLTLLILVPFALNHWYENLKQYSNFERSAAIAVMLLLVVVSLKGLDVRTNKNHYIVAGNWVNKHFDQTTRLFSNDRIIVHYANLGPKSNFIDRFNNNRLQEHISSNRIYSFEVVALSVTDDEPVETQLHESLIHKFGQPIKVIHGDHKRSVVIFETTKNKQPFSKRTN